MPRRAAVLPLALLLSACQPSIESHSKAIIGAILIDGNGGPPLSDSVVVVAENVIQAAGPRSAVPIPSEAAKIDGSNKTLVPVIVDICDSATPAGLVRPSSPEDARSQVAAMAARKIGIIHLAEADAPTIQAALEAARAAGIPVAGHVATQAGARALIDNGASILIGMIRDTENLDAALITRMRDLRVVVAPSLSKAGKDLEIARRNTRRLFQDGVLLAVATEGGDPVHETELLADAGIPPLDAIVAATRNGALALRETQTRGTVEPNKRADLLLLSANPGEDIRNLRRVVLRIQ